MVSIIMFLTNWVNTHDIKTAFSADIKSCNGRSSCLPASAGIVELWAILVAAVLNMVVEMQRLRMGNNRVKQ